MKLMLLVLATAVGGTIGSPKPQDDSGGGFTYTIKAYVERLTSPEEVGHVRFRNKGGSVNKGVITFKQEVNDNNPLYILGAIDTKESIIVDSTNDRLNACSNDDENPWVNVLTSLVNAAILPDGKCPVSESTTYNLDPNLKPMTVSFDSKIECGDYLVSASMGDGTKADLDIIINFTIPENDNCAPPK